MKKKNLIFSRKPVNNCSLRIQKVNKGVIRQIAILSNDGAFSASNHGRAGALNSKTLCRNWIKGKPSVTTPSEDQYIRLRRLRVRKMTSSLIQNLPNKEHDSNHQKNCEEKAVLRVSGSQRMSSSF